MKRRLNGVKVFALLFAFLMLLGCGSKAEQKTLVRKAATKVYEELEKSASGSRDASAEDFADAQDESDNSEALDGVEIPVHKGKLSETIKRRFSYVVSYNHDTKQPNWVAWRIDKRHVEEGNLPRAEFMDDDDMPDPKGYRSDYYNSGYDKGHMCPAGDNKWNEKAMQDCFLMTNMCPQNHSLNAGVWNSIEQQCRSWAKKYGSVYVVCGPIFLNKQQRKIGKNKVLVPDAFFKVVLRMGKNPQAIGFICRNQSQKGRKKTDFINTVDDVERITGYDFFSKLPDSIENRIESYADISEW